MKITLQNIFFPLQTRRARSAFEPTVENQRKLDLSTRLHNISPAHYGKKSNHWYILHERITNQKENHNHNHKKHITSVTKLTDIGLHAQWDLCAYDFTNQQKVRNHIELSTIRSFHNSWLSHNISTPNQHVNHTTFSWSYSQKKTLIHV